MATTQNTYTGNGSTTNYSFTFEYIKQTDVKVTLDDVATTAFTFANATTLSFTTAPTNGAAIRIFRNTDITTLNATFFPGSAIKAEDLNSNFTQTHFATQETDNEVIDANTTADTAKVTANTALTNSNTAVTSANAAVSTANTADTNASAAVTTANAASATATTAANDAASAITTANTASNNASTAVTTANAADVTATTALTNSRESDGSGGFTTAIAKANTAVSTANSANTTSASAVTTANAATTTANTADTNATAAVNTANAASAAVSNAVLFTLISNVSSIPGSPSNNDYIEIGDTTGIESFTPLSGLPSSFVGAATLTVRLRYETATTSWIFMSYFANDSETRYLTKNIPVVTGDSTNGSGQITLNCENNSHGVKIKGPPHSAAASYTLTLPNDAGTSGNVLKTDGSGTTSWGPADVAADTTPQLGGDLFLNTHEIYGGNQGSNTAYVTTISESSAYFPTNFGNNGVGAIGWDFNGTGAARCRADGPNPGGTGTGINALQLGNFADPTALIIKGTGAIHTKADINLEGTSKIAGTIPSLVGIMPSSGGSSVVSLENQTANGTVKSDFRVGHDRIDLYFDSVNHLGMHKDGDLQIMNSLNTQRGIAFYGGSTNNFLYIRPPSSFSTTQYYLPTADGTAGQALITDGNGQTSWNTVSAASEIGVTIQAYDAETAKRDEPNTYTSSATFNGGIEVDGVYKQKVVTVSELVGTVTIDMSQGNFFKTTATGTTFTFTNPPPSGTVGSFTLEVLLSSGTLNWPTSVLWPGGSAPTLTTSKRHVFAFFTYDNGSSYFAAALTDYT